MVEAVLHELKALHAIDVTILIATGTHRGNSDRELESMLGRYVLSSCRVVNHDSRDPGVLVDFGRIGGVPVLLNRLWLEADLRITTGFVEPHFFAGFSGGPKMVAPGLAGLETVMVLHDAKRIGHPSATWGVIEGNPVHDDIRRIARTTGVHFAIDVTLNEDKKITGVFAGELFTEHRRACEAVRQSALREVAEPFDVVLTTNSGYPLDQNLYQAVKGMSAASRVVKPGGIIICAAECRDGLPDHGSYGTVLASQPSPERLLEMIHTPGFSMPDQWQVQIQAQIQRKARVLVRADGLSPDQVRKAHCEPIDDVEKTVRDVLQARGPNSTLCVMPHGPQTIPVLARDAHP